MTSQLSRDAKRFLVSAAAGLAVWTGCAAARAQSPAEPTGSGAQPVARTRSPYVAQAASEAAETRIELTAGNAPEGELSPIERELQKLYERDGRSPPPMQRPTTPPPQINGGGPAAPGARPSAPQVRPAAGKPGLLSRVLPFKKQPVPANRSQPAASNPSATMSPTPAATPQFSPLPSPSSLDRPTGRSVAPPPGDESFNPFPEASPAPDRQPTPPDSGFDSARTPSPQIEPPFNPFGASEPDPPPTIERGAPAPRAETPPARLPESSSTEPEFSPFPGEAPPFPGSTDDPQDIPSPAPELDPRNESPSDDGPFEKPLRSDRAVDPPSLPPATLPEPTEPEPAPEFPRVRQSVPGENGPTITPHPLAAPVAPPPADEPTHRWSATKPRAPRPQITPPVLKAPETDAPPRMPELPADESPRTTGAPPKTLDPEPAARIPHNDAEEPDRRMRLIAERKGRPGFKGFCPVMLRDERDLVDSSPEFTSTFEGRIYQFSSAEAKARFDRHPTKYAPAASGRDVVLQNNFGRDVDGSLDYAVWYRDRLHLFSSRATLETFLDSLAP